jgi:hypothetical protein
MPLRPLYPTKKALKDSIGKPLKYEETSIFGPEYRPNGVVVVETDNWAAEVTMKDGKILKVK